MYNYEWFLFYLTLIKNFYIAFYIQILIIIMLFLYYKFTKKQFILLMILRLIALIHPFIIGYGLLQWHSIEPDLPIKYFDMSGWLGYKIDYRTHLIWYFKCIFIAFTLTNITIFTIWYLMLFLYEQFDINHYLDRYKQITYNRWVWISLWVVIFIIWLYLAWPSYLWFNHLDSQTYLLKNLMDYLHQQEVFSIYNSKNLFWIFLKK